MANPFSTNPFRSNPFSTGSDGLNPNSPFASNKRRSTNIGPDEVPSNRSVASNSQYQTPDKRRSTNIGPDELAPGQPTPGSPKFYTPGSADNRRSTNIAPDAFYSAPSTPAWTTPGNNMSNMASNQSSSGSAWNISQGASNHIPPSRPLSPSWNSPGNRLSNLSMMSNIAPDQAPPSPTAQRSNLFHPSRPLSPTWNTPGNRLSNLSMMSNIAPDQAPPSPTAQRSNLAPPSRPLSPTWNTPGNRLSNMSMMSDVAPDQAPPSPTTHRSKPAPSPRPISSSWNIPGNRLSNMSMMTNIAPDQVPSVRSLSPSGSSSEKKLSDTSIMSNIAPDQAPKAPAEPPAWNIPSSKMPSIAAKPSIPSQNPFSSPNYKSEPSANRRSTNIAPIEVPMVQLSKPSSVYKGFTPTDRKSANNSISSELSPDSPFSKPAYQSPTSDKRRSTNIGPDEVGPSKTKFNRTSYGSPSAANRRSTNVGPDEVPTTPVWKNFSTANRKSTNAGSIEATGARSWSTYGFDGQGNRRSTQVSPDEVPSLANTASSTPSAGGRVVTGKPSVAASSTTTKRSSLNFSRKYSKIEEGAIIPQTITVPETGSLSGPKPVINSPTTIRMVDTPMQTPVKSSFPAGTLQSPTKNSFPTGGPMVDTPMQTPIKSSFPAGVLDTGKNGHSSSIASEALPKNRTASVAAMGRRPSAAAGHSAANGRRASTAGGPRRSSVSVTNVVIPAHLLTHIETNWQEDKIVGRRKSAYQREDSRKSFNIQSMAKKQQDEVKNIINTTPLAPRQLSDSMLALSKADPFAASRKSRGKSLAAVNEKETLSEEDESGGAPTFLTPFGQYSWNPAMDGLSPGKEIGDPLAAAGSTLRSPSAMSGSFNIEVSEPPRRRSIWRGSVSGDPNGYSYGERKGSIFQRAGSVFQDTMMQVKKKVRRSSMWDLLDNAKKRQVELRRQRWVQIVFEYTFYLFLLAILYFIIIGVPLWKGTYWELYLAFKYKLNTTGTWSVVIIVAVLYSYSPLLVLFEPDPPMPEEPIDPEKTPNISDTALMIPCYKAASLIGATLEAATKVFPPSHIFVVANGNSPTPLDDTEEICRPYGVNHIWSPVGSKIVAQFVGCYAAKEFKNVLLIDDDCALPPNFPIVSDRLKGKVMCMGYTIKSVGPNSSKGTLCQQAQDLEYKISGIQRALAGKIGSATFPHGAISLWDREFLIKTFNKHPGFSVSEDWFFGHVARQLGCRTQMATSVFIETETPPAVFFSSGGARGGFGEMTVFKQRFLRWNFFFVNGMYYNLHYILFSWALGWWEIGTKLFVFQEIYETLLYLATPIVVPVSLVVRPQFFFELMALTFVLYMLNALIFNEIHLRRKKERVPWKCVWLYYMPYKLVLTFVNVASCYWALYKYATYFANRHPKIIEDEAAINVVLQLEEEEFEDDVVLPAGGRRMSVTAVGSQVDVPGGAPGGRRMTITAMGQRFSNPDITITEEDEEEEEELIPKPERKASISIVKTGEEPAPFEARRPSITVGGRRVSIGAATVVDETPPVKTRRSSDAFVSKGLVEVVTTPKSSGRRSSDAQQSKGITAAARRKMSSAKGSSAFMHTTVIEEEVDEADDEPILVGASNVQSKRASKRKSQLRQSYVGPIVEVSESEVPEVPTVDDALMSRIQAIEDALNARGIGAVDFAVHDNSPNIIVEGEEEEDEAEELAEPRSLSRDSSASPTQDEKKHADAHSMV